MFVLTKEGFLSRYFPVYMYNKEKPEKFYID